MRQILVVANQTLGGDELHRAVQELMDSAPTEFWVVAPATTKTNFGTAAVIGLGDNLALAESPPHTPGAYEEAERRLREGLLLLRGLGATVDGEVGDSDPMNAIEHALHGRHVDEILISTLPKHVSRWLHTDLPSRVHRKFDLEVTTVTAREHSLH